MSAASDSGCLVLRLSRFTSDCPSPDISQGVVMTDDAFADSGLFAYTLVGAIESINAVDGAMGFYVDYDALAAHIILDKRCRDHAPIDDDDRWIEGDDARSALRNLIKAAEKYREAAREKN